MRSIFVRFSAHRRKKQDFKRLLLESLEDRRMMARQVSGTLTSNDVWSDTIEVTADFSVPSGIQLTIAPGTTVKVREGQYVFFGAGSTVNALGNSASRITFTTVQDDSVGEDLTGITVGVPKAGHWESLYVDSSNVTLEFADIRYAGNIASAGNTNGFVPSLSIRNGSKPTFRNTNITDADGLGIDIGGNAGPTLDRVAIDRTRQSAISQALTADPIYSGLSLPTSGGSHIRLQGGTITANRSMDFDGKPVHLTSDLSIADGTANVNNFEFGDDRQGVRCPWAAHVRKVYPRNDVPGNIDPLDEDVDQAEARTQTHRIMRRGI